MNKTLSIICLLICLSPPAWSITYIEIVQGLEALGDLEAAYPLAYQLAQKQNTYQAWRNVAIKYAKFDIDDKAYLQAWQQAYAINQEAIYRDFMKIRPQSQFNNHAIHALFKLLKASENIEDYHRFMTEFPNVVESIEALLKTYELAFQRAKAANNPSVFDAFIITFPDAKQIPEAIELAFQAEKQIIEKKLSKVTNYEQREYIARRLFNEARVAEKQHKSLVAARKYRLLNSEIFIETKVFTELLDREERFAYQQIIQAQQAKIAKSINDMQEAVVETFETRIQHLEKALLNQLQFQGQRLETIIATHNKLLSQQLNTVNKNLQQGYLSGVGADMAELIPIVGSGLKIAKIIGKISPAIARALAKPNKSQAVLFNSI